MALQAAKDVGPAEEREAPPALAPASRRRRVRRVLSVIGLVVLVIVAVVVTEWWTHGRFVESTNDAYLRADQTAVAPKVSGYVEQVFVTDNQPVVLGQPLVKIDAASYQAASAQAAATVEARLADVAAAESQLSQHAATVDQARAQLAGAQANATYTAGEAERFRRLSAQGVEPQERYAQARNQHDQAAANLKAQAEALRATERQQATLETQVKQARAQVEAARAAARSNEINLSDTLLRAGIAGRIGDKTVQAGQFVQPGLRLMSIVPVSRVYLVANFKETQIGRMRVGQHATVKIDAFGGRAIDAVVESFAPGTGAQFSLLPPENATGNFTKVVQRVPVRLALRPPADLRDRLIPGLSATVKIDTTQSSGQSSGQPSGARS